MTKMLKWLIVMFIPLLGLTLTSCPDKPVDEPTTNEDLIVGRWKLTFSDGYQIITFEKSGICKLWEIEYGDEPFSSTGTWNISNDILTVEYWDNGSHECVVAKILSLTKTKMVLFFEGTEGGVEEFTRID